MMSSLEVSADQALTTKRFARDREFAELCVVLVSYNTAHLLDRCIGSLRAASVNIAVKVIIVDNASRDHSAAVVRERFTDCILIENAVNVGFGRANNQALEYVDSEFILLLNVDAFVLPDTLEKSIRHMRSHPECGVSGVCLLNDQHAISYAGRSFPAPWKNFKTKMGLESDADRTTVLRFDPDAADAARQCDWVVGCYYLTRKSVIEQVGLFDARYFLYYEEVDHCRAVKQAGWTVECLTNAGVEHIGGASAESESVLTSGARQISALQLESELLYHRKHGGLLGLLLNVSLTVLADVIRAINWVAKGRSVEGAKGFWRNAQLVAALALRTRLGSRPIH
jgi:N-acetylglucosaminyl-diphospho-decaprenol L-rhamnosyltransferase